MNTSWTSLRIKRSGYVHRWGPVYDKHWRSSSCGYTRSTKVLTETYPPKCRHCPHCFPEGAP